MADLKTRVENLATAIATKVKANKTFINGNVADLSGLLTTTKAHLVAAINEVRAVAISKQDALGFVPIDATTKGAANGVASLDNTGKVPAAQLPAYVDDVLEYANALAFPASGETGKLYVAMDTGWIHRWSGTGYIHIDGSPGSTDAVPEGVNKYFTDTRAVAALAPSLGNTDTDFAAVFAAGLA